MMKRAETLLLKDGKAKNNLRGGNEDLAKHSYIWSSCHKLSPNDYLLYLSFKGMPLGEPSAHLFHTRANTTAARMGKGSIKPMGREKV